MSFFRRWPSLVSRGKYPVFLAVCWAYATVWVLLWIHLYLVWGSAGLYYRWGLLLLLGLASPSLPDLFRSYDSYRQEQERLYKRHDRKETER